MVIVLPVYHWFCFFHLIEFCLTSKKKNATGVNFKFLKLTFTNFIYIE